MKLDWHYRPTWTQMALRENLIALEVGVDKGINAFFMLQNLNIEKLYLIDPYYIQSDEFDENGERPYIKSECRPTYEAAKKLLEPFKDKIEWLIGTTEEMINKVPMLDLCYIDGIHSYEGCKSDIELCLPKMEIGGGVIGGHDFCKEHKGIVKAVTEKFSRGEVFVGNRDWWVIIHEGMRKIYK